MPFFIDLTHSGCPSCPPTTRLKIQRDRTICCCWISKCKQGLDPHHTGPPAWPANLLHPLSPALRLTPLPKPTRLHPQPGHPPNYPTPQFPPSPHTPSRSCQRPMRPLLPCPLTRSTRWVSRQLHAASPGCFPASWWFLDSLSAASLSFLVVRDQLLGRFPWLTASSTGSSTAGSSAGSAAGSTAGTTVGTTARQHTSLMTAAATAPCGGSFWPASYQTSSCSSSCCHTPPHPTHVSCPLTIPPPPQFPPIRLLRRRPVVSPSQHLTVSQPSLVTITHQAVITHH